ncbi:MAG: response regulator [Phycisphaeraceae bacterium JB051]
MTTQSQEQKMILYVDDEDQALKYFDKIFGKHFATLTARSTDEAIALLKENSDRVGVLMTDQRMPKRLGLDLLMHVRDEYPHIVRILTTAYAELDNAIDAVNKGEIYRYITKPWNIQELKETLHQALSYKPITCDCAHVIRPYAILAAGLAGSFRGCKQAVNQLIEHWPNPSSICPADDTQQFIRLADTLNQAGPAMDDKIAVAELVQSIENTQSFAGSVNCDGDPQSFCITVNNRMTQAAMHALNRVAIDEGVCTPTVKVAQEVRQQVTGLAIHWQVLPNSDETQQVQWSANLMLVYLFVFHHGGQITVKQHEITLWLPHDPRAIKVSESVENWLSDIV